MFNKNAYLQLQQCSPTHINSFSHLAPDEILFHHHDMLSGHYLAGGSGDPPLVDAAAFFNHQDAPNSFPRAAKKDRHSKIYTAQGPRDRRVRLSIGVARRFFDLQEILGFDKPSKTLDWLLTKSKSAIKDLVQSTKETATSSDQCEVDSAEHFGADSKRKQVETNGNSSKLHASDLAKESRVRARARARERTREKMYIKKLNDQINNGYDHDLTTPSIPIQYMNNQLEFCKISGSSCSDDSMFHCQPTQNEQDLIQEESIVIKRKVKHPSSILGFQQNLIISSSNYAVPSPFSPADNWDISTSFASQSNICAILDHHKFINRYD